MQLKFMAVDFKSSGIKEGSSVLHFRIFYDPNGKYYIWTNKFNSINALIDYHRHQTIYGVKALLLRDCVTSKTFGSVGSGPNAVFNNPRVQTNSGSRGVHAQATEGASLLSKEQSLQNTTGLPPGIEVHVKREAEINSLNELIFKQNLKLQRLERDLLNRDSELSVLRKRCRMFDEVLRYKATLAKLTITMEQAEQYANLTAKSYPANNNSNAVRDSLDVINTDPAPLMIRDVDVNIDSNHSTENGSLMEQVGKTFVQSEGQRTKTLAHIVSNGQICLQPYTYIKLTKVY
ncbi:unnamed protein product [Heterobilharzia americana]|nr:unnamed protein product [Heterobilharzia americana]